MFSKAAELAPGPGYHELDFSSGSDLETEIGSWSEEWQSAIIQPDGADLVFRCDGTAPIDATNGILIPDGEAWLFENQPALLRAMQMYGGDAKVHLFG